MTDLFFSEPPSLEDEFTPDGYVSLNRAVVYTFVVQMEHSFQVYEGEGGFQVQRLPPLEALARSRHPRIWVNIKNHEGEMQPLALWPPLAEAIRESNGLLFFEEMYCTTDWVRRMLSSGIFPSWAIDADGQIIPVPTHYWNTEKAKGPLESGLPALWSDYPRLSWLSRGGRVIVRTDDVMTWLTAWKGEAVVPLLTWLTREETPVPQKTPGDECFSWLDKEMKGSPNHQPEPKEHYREEAKRRFKVSVRGFDRAWDLAKLGNPDASAWGRAGRKSLHKSKQRA